MIKRIALCITMSTLLLASDEKNQLLLTTDKNSSAKHEAKSLSLQFDLQFILKDLTFFSNKVDEYINNQIDIPVGIIAHLSNASISLCHRALDYASAFMSITYHPAFFWSGEFEKEFASPFPDDNSTLFKIYNECLNHTKENCNSNGNCSMCSKLMIEYLIQIKPKLSKQVKAVEYLLEIVDSTVGFHAVGLELD